MSRFITPAWACLGTLAFLAFCFAAGVASAW